MMLLLPALLSAATLRLDSALTESCAEVGGLRSWLCHLSFDIPDVHLKVDGFNIDLEKTRCGSVLLGELSSSISPAGAPAPTFRLGVQDLGLNCTVGRFSFKYGIIGGSGAATVLLRSATLETGVELELDRDNLAVAAKQIAHPSMVIGEIELELHGSVLVKIADAFKGVIERALKTQLPAPILGLLDGLIAGNLTSALHSLDHWVRPYLNATAPLPEPAAPAEAVDWRASGPLELLDFLVDSVVGASGVDGLVRLLTGGTGDLVLPRHALPLLPTLPLGGLANLSVILGGVNISGLDSLSSLQLLKPVPGTHGTHGTRSTVATDDSAAPSSLASRLVLGGASVAVDLNLTVTPTLATLHAPPLTESFRVVLDVHQATAAVLLLLSVNGTALSRLSPADLRQPACLLGPLLEAGVRGLGVGLGSSQLSVLAQQGELEVDIDEVLNNATSLILRTFASVIPRAANGLVGGPLRNLTNRLLHGLVDHLRPPPGLCAALPVPPPPAPPSPAAIDWNASPALELLDFVIDQAVGADGPLGLDGLIRMLTGGSGEAVVPAGTLPALRHNISGLGQLEIAVGELNISGLDSLAALQLLKPVPADSAALSSALALGSLNVSLDLLVAIETAGGARTSSALRVSLALRDVELQAAGRLALNASGLSGLQLNQIVPSLLLNCSLTQARSPSPLTRPTRPASHRPPAARPVLDLAHSRTDSPTP